MKKIPKVKLPIWKVYLYSVVNRWILYKQYNKGYLDLKLSYAEIGHIRDLCKRFLHPTELRTLTKARRYSLLIDRVDFFPAKIEAGHSRTLHKLRKVSIIKTESLIMEIKQLKKFALEELGIPQETVNFLNTEELIYEIIKKTDPHQTYSMEFAKWFDALDDEFFEKAEGVIDVKQTKKENKMNDLYQEVIEAVNEADSKNDLVEIIDEYESIFEGFEAPKTKTKMKKAMLEWIKEKEKEEETEVIEGDEEESEEEEIIMCIRTTDDIDDLKEIVDEYENFKGIKFTTGKKSKPRDIEDVRSDMLKLIGVDEEEDEEDEEEEIETKESVKETEEEEEEEEEEDEDEEEEEDEDEAVSIEVTDKTVDQWVKAKDIVSLQEICESLAIPLRPLEKKNPKRMGEKIKDKLSEEKVEPEETEKPSDERTSVYYVIEEMVLEGADEKEIIKAVSPIFEARNKKKKQIKELVRQFITIVEADYDL